MMKIMTTLGLMAIMMSLSAPAMAMGNKPQNPQSNVGGSQSSGSSSSGDDGGVMSTANDLGNNDAVQQGAGDLGEAIAKGGQSLVNQGYEAANNGATNANAQKIINTGTNIFAGGKTLEYAGKAAPHVGWVATSAGYAAEGQHKGAAIQAVNGVTRTVTIAKIGAAAASAGGIWATGKLGALAGSWAGPLGAATGFVIGCGAAYVGGKIWDKTLGQGADALTQKAADMDAQSQYGADSQDGGQASSGGGGAGWDGGNGRDNAQQTVRDNIPRPPVGSGSGGGGGGGCTCSPGR